MKTRIHRFWLSISLATLSLASPLSDKLWSHDLPTRWSPEAVSSSHSDSDWNYLLDDCLDQRESVGASALFASSSGGSSKPDSADRSGVDFDVVLSRHSLARFTSEMACWVSQWERIQAQAGEAARADLIAHKVAKPRPSAASGLTAKSAAADLIAARPDFGQPPAPTFAQTDTCGFEAEYQAMRAAAELLDNEMAAPAAKPAVASSTLPRP